MIGGSLRNLVRRGQAQSSGSNLLANGLAASGPPGISFPSLREPGNSPLRRGRKRDLLKSLIIIGSAPTPLNTKTESDET